MRKLCSKKRKLFGTRAKRHEISWGNLTMAKKHEILSGHLIRISSLGINHIRCDNAPWKYTQSPAWLNITSLPSLHHIFATNPNPRLNPSNHYCTSSRHVKSFSNICIDLLAYISVTFATSHWFRFRLKAVARSNTVARKEGRLHSQSTRKKRRRKSPDQNTVKLKEGKQTLFWFHPSPHQPKPPSEPVQVTIRHPQTYVSSWSPPSLHHTIKNRIRHQKRMKSHK